MNPSDEEVLAMIGRLHGDISRMRRLQLEDKTEEPVVFTGICEECKKHGWNCFLDPEWKSKIPSIPKVPKVIGIPKVVP